MLDEQILQTTPSIPFTLRTWILLNAGSWLLGSSIGHFITYLIATIMSNTMAPPPAIDSGDFHFGPGMYILFVRVLISAGSGGFILGLINGILQTLFLRSYQISPWRWTGFSIIS